MDGFIRWSTLVALYSATLFIECFCAVIRYFFFKAVLRVILAIVLFLLYLIVYFFPFTELFFGVFVFTDARFFVIFVEIFAVIVALYPIIFSALTFYPKAFLGISVIPGGGYFTRWALGAEYPSRRQLELFTNALNEIYMSAPQEYKALLHNLGNKKFFVLSNVGEVNAFVVGDTLYVTSGLLTSPYLNGLLAHEIAHLQSLDGVAVLALRRLVLYPVYFIPRLLGRLGGGVVSAFFSQRDSVGCCIGGVGFFGFVLFLSLAGGGFGNIALNLLWYPFWRQREFDADRFAKMCGQHQSLIEYLEDYRLLDIAVPYFLSVKPYNEQRLDRLLD
jgi:hypothetical protein